MRVAGCDNPRTKELPGPVGIELYGMIKQNRKKKKQNN